MAIFCVRHSHPGNQNCSFLFIHICLWSIEIKSVIPLYAWNVSFSYTFSHVDRYVAREMNFKSETIQSITLSANVSLTKNWRLAMSTGYDIANHGMSYTTVDIYRDLHCWEMRFSWVPFGYYQSWFFQINIKADALRDVKYEKRKTYLENQSYYSY